MEGLGEWEGVRMVRSGLGGGILMCRKYLVVSGIL